MTGLFIVYWVVAGCWVSVLSWLDWTTRRLPNWLTVGGAVVALLFRLGYGGWPMFLDGFAAAAAAGAFLLLPFLARGAGGGDVKMMFAAGAIVGWKQVLMLLLYTSLAGLVLGVVLLAFGKMDASRLKHYARCMVDWRYDRAAGCAALPPKDSEAVRMPFSLAITVGMLAALF